MFISFLCILEVLKLLRLPGLKQFNFAFALKNLVLFHLVEVFDVRKLDNGSVLVSQFERVFELFFSESQIERFSVDQFLIIQLQLFVVFVFFKMLTHINDVLG